MKAEPNLKPVKDAWLKGKLLIALPTLVDDTFYRTVILVLAHAPQGALGVVLNRPTDVAVAELFPQLALEAVQPSVLFTGGPVEPDGIICLARGASEEAPGFAPVLDTWGSIDPREPPPTGVDAVRVYRGYAGWSARQLESELARNSWLVLDALPSDLATTEPEDMWTRVLERQGPRYSRLTLVPRNPSLN
jgi:putative transcriptional regulator